MKRGYYIRICTNGHQGRTNIKNNKVKTCSECQTRWVWQIVIDASEQRIEPKLEINTPETTNKLPTYKVPTNVGELLVTRPEITIPLKKVKALNIDTRKEFISMKKALTERKPRRS